MRTLRPLREGGVVGELIDAAVDEPDRDESDGEKDGVGENLPRPGPAPVRAQVRRSNGAIVLHHGAAAGSTARSSACSSGATPVRNSGPMYSLANRYRIAQMCDPALP